ncbi:glycoside hydrolase N-terminal domain-containing protein [Salipaludibacillus agaradhaerens]|uniref:glycoside hydrolase family 95 protein n=1 Tax=Salipaludibacillus agaradhaerens TaxID=76935 RepID=UPI002150BC38|nr:glycoside hydrolase family 95 protein [Salipaludibacillus agaradhaerens]MCR6105483.1 glycoside hydrolase N-terminal domain-containing protein [Salipaludibacillus agaradhaerens]MCR6117521.1 glycoside hydrolase N-terminal domain-containing protein [Salipaludibacillus agaradhaerens]
MREEYAITKFPKKGLTSGKPAQRWEDALVTGNGTIGALIYGDPLNEMIILNHEKLYEPFHDSIIHNNDLFPYGNEVKALMKRGKFKDAAALFSKKSGHPLYFTDAYHPAYALNLQTNQVGEVSHYFRTVDFTSGEVSVHWQDRRGRFFKQHFSSRTHNAIIIRLSSADGAFIHAELSIDDLMPEEGVELTEISASGHDLSFTCSYEKTKKGYAGMSIVSTSEGTITAEKESLHIKGTKEIIIVTRIVPLTDYAEQKDATLSRMQMALKTLAAISYEELMNAHRLVHEEIYNRMTLTLGENTARCVTTEQLLAEQTGELDSHLLQKMFEMGRYVLLCSSGDYPPNLVGLWTGDWRPPWSGDFTVDANLNLAISGAAIGNMSEALESYFYLIEKIAPDWEDNAKTLYGCRGYLAGSRTDGNHNIHTHFNEDWPLGFWTAAAGWLALPFYQWYEITEDTTFFKNRVLPLMKKIALFYEDFLTETDENEKWLFIPSYSPENTPIISAEKKAAGWQEHQATINATMDIAVTKEIMTHLIKTCKELQIEEEKISVWETILARLPDYMTNEDGALKEWIHEELHDRYDHRHLSHLYPVWPGDEVTPEETPEWFRAAAIALEKKERGNGSAHGVMHSGLVAARLKRGDLVEENLRWFLSSDYIYTSLVTAHNPGRRIYNVDGNCSLPSLIMEMLVCSRHGFLELLPALPKALSSGSLTGMLCKGQLTLNKITWHLESKTINVTITSHKVQHVQIVYRHGIEQIAINGKEETIHPDQTEVSLFFKANERKELVLTVK